MTTSVFIKQLEYYQKQYRRGLITLEELEKMSIDIIFAYFADNNSENRNKEHIVL